MKKIVLFNILIGIVSSLLVISPCWAFNNVYMRTLVKDKPNLNSVTFTAYFNGDDSKLLTEDSWNNISDNAGYYHTGPYGACRVDTDDINTLEQGSNYDIWVANENKGGHASKQSIGLSSPSDTSPLPNPLILAADGFLAIPGGFSATGEAGKIKLNWSPVNGAEYRIYRRDSRSTAIVYEKVATTTETEYFDSTASDINIEYRYIIISVADGKRSGHGEEEAAYPQPAILTGIILTSSAPNMKAGEIASLEVIATYNNQSTEDVTGQGIEWTVSGPQGYSISNVGNFTPKIPGTYIITAKYNVNNVVKTSDEITIEVASGTLESIALTTSRATIETGGSVTLSAIGKDANSNSVDFVNPVRWSLEGAGSLNSLIGNSVSLTAGKTPGKCSIKVDCDGKTANMEITIIAGALDYIKVSPENAIVEKGETVSFTVSGYDQYGNKMEVSPSSNIYTANDIGSNQVAITATANGKSASENVSITVIPKIEGGIIIQENNLVVENDEDVNINLLAIIDEKGSTINLKDCGLSMKYDGEGVSENGVFSPAGLKDGAYTVQVTLQTLSPITTQAVINVNRTAPEITVTDKYGDKLSDNAIISAQPDFNVAANDLNGLGELLIYVDGVKAQAAEVKASAAGNAASASYNSTLAPGTHELKVVARDKLGKESVVTVAGLTVYGSVAVAGTPMNYPNPFRPAHSEPTTIKYNLTDEGDIKIIICDITGKQVFSTLCAARTEGGKTGVNKVSFDGKDASGQVLGNGAYHYFLIHEDKVIGRGQIAVLD